MADMALLHLTELVICAQTDHNGYKEVLRVTFLSGISVSRDRRTDELKADFVAGGTKTVVSEPLRM